MFRIFYADSDATMYEANSLQTYNTGLDEILQIQKTMSTSGGNIKVSRILIKFDINEISSSM